MLSTGLVAIDSTILATAVTSIVDDLGGFTQFPWLFSVYLLAQASSTPIYGKLADTFGRKSIMLTGVGLFVLGSVLCGLAWNMPSLIGFRIVQGLGAGAVAPMSMTIIGDVYSLAERAKVQGYVASVWAISSVVGPTLGGVFSQYLSWRWIFFVNIPLGIAAMVMLSRRFTEAPREASKPRIDYAGAALIATGTALTVLGLLEGGVLWSWTSWQSVTVLGLGVLLLVAVVPVERRAAEPIMPGWIFRNRLLVVTSLASILVGGILIGLTSYVPLYSEGVLGTSALVAGLALAAMTMGWPLAASNAGRVYLRYGFRVTGLIGSGFALMGTLLLLLLTVHPRLWLVAFGCFVVGIGLGFIASPTLIAAQASVDWSARGVVTGTNMFGRSLGSAVGVAIFGAIANAALGVRVGGHQVTPDSVDPDRLAHAVHLVFVGSVALAVVMILAVAMMPRDRPSNREA
ncbi:MDR family MFS transporter [Dermacoccaceae bacterium W4C1]